MSTVAEAASRTKVRTQVRRRRARRIAKRIPFLLLVAIIILYIGFPFYWAVRSAFTPDS